MRQIPVTNHGKANLHIAGIVIRPGSTRMVDARNVPPEYAPPFEPAPAEEPPADPVLALLDHKTADIADALPGLDDDALARLAAAEQAGKTRKGVIEAIAAEQLRRAAGE
jgi:hypothetical protein